MFIIYIETILLSLVQGISEFIPVSSSAHLIIISQLGNFKNNSLEVDISLHLGSLAGIIFYFRSELFNILKNKNLALLVFVGSLPLVVFGFIIYQTGLISYLLFEDNKIKIDEHDLPPYIKNNKGLMPSHSMGKSLVSYVTGYAICEGYIDNVNVKLDDWPILKGTLYEGQKLIDILNMRAGDQSFIGEKKQIPILFLSMCFFNPDDI